MGSYVPGMEVWNPNIPAFSQNFWFESMITDINTAVAMIAIIH